MLFRVWVGHEKGTFVILECFIFILTRFLRMISERTTKVGPTSKLFSFSIFFDKPNKGKICFHLIFSLYFPTKQMLCPSSIKHIYEQIINYGKKKI